MTKNFKAIVAAVTLGLFCLTQVGLAMTSTGPATQKQQCSGTSCYPPKG